jgi:PAS domain S-box-containing protein
LKFATEIPQSSVLTMEASAAAVRKPEAIESPKQKILLVDDSDAILLSLSAVLEPLNEEILTANNADAALKHLLKTDPAVIVLDILMPGTDGIELASIIRQRERFRHTPIIFLTGLEDRSAIQGYKAGAVDFLVKPVNPDVLRYKVKVFVDLAKQSDMLKKFGELMRSTSVELQAALNETLRAKQELEKEFQERRRVELKRDQLAGRLAATPDFVSAMAEGAVTLDLEGRILFANARFGEMVQRTDSELLGTSIRDLIAEGSEDAFWELFQQGKKHRVTDESELRAPDGHLIPVQLTLSAFASENLQAVALVVTDLRDQKRTEQLIAEGRLARHIFQQAHSGMVVCDRHGRVVMANAVIHQLCGENILFHEFDRVCPLVVRDKASQTRQFSCFEVLHGERHRFLEVELSRNGRTLHLLMNAGAIQSDDGAKVGALLTFIDITERKSIEDALRRSEKLASAGRIAGALAHEINNPLSAVTNILYLLQHSDLEQEQKHYLDLASSELSRISNIVRRTLSFYRESARPVQLAINEVLDNVLEVYGKQIEAKSVEVIKRYNFNEPISGYPGELRQVFSNIVANAIDALKPNSRLIVKTRSTRHPHTGNPAVRVTIADEGHGIPREIRSRLFEPFTTTKGERGTGLGLWVSRGIIQKQGGIIHFRSANGESLNSGTVFSVLIPCEVDSDLAFSEQPAGRSYSMLSSKPQISPS